MLHLEIPMSKPAAPAPASKEGAGEHDEQAKPKSGLMGKLALAGFVAVVMLLETALFFFLIPSADDVAALAEARLTQDIKHGEDEKQAAHDQEQQVIEVPLGQFGVIFQPVDSERNFRVEFSLFALLRKANQENLQSQIHIKEGRIRHEVLMKVRTSTLEELQENNLGSIQRRILGTCNQLLDEPLILSVGFQDYQVFEQ